MEKKFIKRVESGDWDKTGWKFYDIYEIYSFGRNIEEFVRGILTDDFFCKKTGDIIIKDIPLIMGCIVPGKRISFSRCYTEQEIQGILAFIPDYAKRGYVDVCTMIEWDNGSLAVSITPIIAMKDLQHLCNKIKVHYRYEE